MSANDLATRLASDAATVRSVGMWQERNGDCISTLPEIADRVDAAADLLRVQAEQLDTLRNAKSVRERAEQLARVCTDQQLVALRDLWADEMDRRKGAPRGGRIAPSDALAAAGGGVPAKGATDEQ